MIYDKVSFRYIVSMVDVNIEVNLKLQWPPMFAPNTPLNNISAEISILNDK